MAAILATLALANAPIACGSDRTTSPEGVVHVTVAPTWISGVTRTVAGVPRVHFSIDATIHNDGLGDVQLTLPNCAPPIERRTARGWSPAVSGGFCAPNTSAPIVIPARTSLVQRIDVDAELPGRPVADIPVWNAPSVAGIYRVHLDLTTPGPTLPLFPEGESASQPFTILD